MLTIPALHSSGGEDPPQLSVEPRSQSRVGKLSMLLVLNSIMFTGFYLWSEWTSDGKASLLKYFFNFCYLICYGLIIDILFIFAYINIYRKLKDYHEKALNQLSSDEDRKYKIKYSTREIFRFFCYICFMLLMQSSFLLNKVLTFYSKEKRLEAVLIIFMQVSHVLMDVGVSLSIKRAYRAQVKNVRRQS